MEIVLNSFLAEKDYEKVYQLFYQFYVKLYGKKLFNKYRMGNAVKANASMNEINQNETMKLLKVIEDDELLAISRFRINEFYDELIVPDIIVDKKLDKEKTDEIYRMILLFFDKYANEKNLPRVFVEIPWFDRTYQYWASEFNYKFPDDKDMFYVKSTCLAEKNLVYNMGDKNEWTRNRKQTKR